MKTDPTSRPISLSVTSRLAPEDLRPGLDVVILSVTLEYPSFLWLDGASSSREETVRIPYLHSLGTPLRIKAVCLPFLLVRSPSGRHRTLDIRRVQLGRIDPEFAKAVRKSRRQKIAPPER